MGVPAVTRNDDWFDEMHDLYSTLLVNNDSDVLYLYK